MYRRLKDFVVNYFSKNTPFDDNPNLSVELFTIEEGNTDLSSLFRN